jgi:stringent starvation protein B
LAELSRRPYLLRAMHEWMLDCGHTPHLIVDATREGVQVPPAYVKEGRIVLNISPSATHALRIDGEAVQFSARFGGVSRQVHVPLDAVLGIYARETGQGMVFNEEAAGAADGRGPEPPDPAPAPNGPASGPGKEAPRSKRPSLKVVK